MSEDHTVFTIDANCARTSSLLRAERVRFVEGATQRTLPAWQFEAKLDAALLDGPHAFPFPQLEYFYIYPHLAEGALLAIDDIHIRSVHDLYRFLKADRMFELLEVVDRAALFRRTGAPLFDPLGDGWESQEYNRRLLLRYTWRERLRKRVPRPIKNALRSRSPARIVSPVAVGCAARVRGTARVPEGCRLWVLVRRSDQDGWWPQGGGPVNVREGAWELECQFGEPQDAGYEFEIAAVVSARSNTASSAVRLRKSARRFRSRAAPARQPSSGCGGAAIPFESQTGELLRRSARPVQLPRGLTQFSPEKRPKSPSVEQSVRPCSIAHAAR